MFKFWGGTFLLIGAMIGGGIVAIPIVSAQFGFLTTWVFIIIAWLVMTKTGLSVLSLACCCPERYNSYFSIVGKFLGSKAQVITVFLFLWLLYFSLSSYISGCVSLMMGYFTSSSSPVMYFTMSTLFVVFFGGLLVLSGTVILRLNVALVITKLSLLGLTLFAVASHGFTFQMTKSSGFLQNGAISMAMVIINAFGYQFIIPSLVSYYGAKNKSLFKAMIISSTTVVMILYTLWLYTIYTVIPFQGSHGLVSIYHSDNQLMALNQSLQYYLESHWEVSLITLFESVALFGSFFCVSLGVFDFLLDAFKASNRWIIGVMTFLPPLLLTLCSENMYVHAMSLAGYIAIVLEIIIPSFAQSFLRRRFGV